MTGSSKIFFPAIETQRSHSEATNSSGSSAVKGQSSATGQGAVAKASRDGESFHQSRVSNKIAMVRLQVNIVFNCHEQKIPYFFKNYTKYFYLFVGVCFVLFCTTGDWKWIHWDANWKSREFKTWGCWN